MSKALIILVLAIIFLSWNFIFKSSEKLDFTDDAKVLQGLSQVIGYKSAVKKFWQEKGEFPTVENWKGIPDKPNVDFSKSLVKSIEVGVEGPGLITVTYANKSNIKIVSDIDGKKITLKPEVKGDRLIWSCYGTLKKELLPKKCQ